MAPGRGFGNSPVIVPLLELIATIFFSVPALHVGVERLGDDQRPFDVDGHDRVQELEAHAPEALRRPIAGARFVPGAQLAAIVVDAGVVDQHVDRHVREPRGEGSRLLDVGDVERLDANLRILRHDFGERSAEARAGDAWR